MTAQPTSIHNCPEQSLGSILNRTAAPSHSGAHYDLSKPPRLDGEILKHLRSRIHQIPPMPETWQRIQQILESPDASAADLGNCVVKDPVLTARILKVCNSSAYSGASSSEISNIPLAIARLGLDETSNIIFRSLAPQMGGSALSRDQVHKTWLHAQALSSLTRTLSESCPKLSRHDASLIGMLHDIGKLVILNIEPDEKLLQLKAAIDGGCDALLAEQQQLGYTHIDAGVILALHWQLPKRIQHFISYHHHAAMLPVSAIPKEYQHGMMALTLAHLILDHFMPPDPEDDERLIWDGHSCSFANINTAFINDELQLSLSSEPFYRQLQGEVERIRLSFPDLGSS